jgi:hypothetical protein
VVGRAAAGVVVVGRRRARVVVERVERVVVSTSRTVVVAAAGCTQPCSMQRSTSCHLLSLSLRRYHSHCAMCSLPFARPLTCLCAACAFSFCIRQLDQFALASQERGVGIYAYPSCALIHQLALCNVRRHHPPADWLSRCSATKQGVLSDI